QALCFRLFGKKRVFCFSAEDFTDAVSEAAAADSLDEMRREYSTVDVLLFDDLQMLSAADGSREEFFNFFNWLLAHGRPVVITSSEPPENLKKFEDRILSRLSWGISFVLDTPNFEMRIGIAGSLARRYGLSISDEIIKYVAGRNEDGHKMEDFFRKMSVVASLAQRPIDLRFVKEMLGDGAREPRKPTIDEIQSAVADEFGLSRSEMNGKTRRKEVAWPRQVGMYLARELTDYSLEEIGGLFGGRDHATVVHACRRVGRTVAEDSTTRVRVATLRRRILEASILNGRSA
ncbi:MAG: DnaA/Hda family protein, partial [Candidatus Brocadiia bacterium]